MAKRDVGEAMTNLIMHTTQPLNAEPPLARLRGHFITAWSDFYVRCHGDVPRVEEAGHRLAVVGRVAQKLDLSLDALKSRFEAKTVTSVLQCAGNRRSDMLAVRQVAGDPWGPGAIGNASWTGAALADVLRAAGVDEGAGLHVAFSALDDMTTDGQTFRYAVSIPLAKALAPEVLLAYTMNGAPLRPEHGFPLRALVPGYAGVRSAKWLAAIEVRDSPADAPVQRKDYKLFPPHLSKETADLDAGITIDEMPLNAAICEPARHAKLAAGRNTVRGYAITANRRIARVDVSGDGGRTWVQAGLHADPAAPWSWTFWDAALDLGRGEHELAARAWDSTGQTQPATPDEVWNFKGYLCTAWHRVPVTVA